MLTLEDLLAKQDISLLVLKYCSPQALFCLSKVSQALNSVVYEHWQPRCQAEWPDAIQAAQTVGFHETPLPILCRNLVLAHCMPVASHVSANLPAPLLQTNQIRATIRCVVGDHTLISVSDLLLEGAKFTYQPTNEQQTIDWHSSDIRLIMTLYRCDVPVSRMLINSTPIHVVDNLHRTRRFVGTLLNSVTRFRVVSQASVRTKLSTSDGVTTEQLRSISVRFLNNDHTTDVWINDHDDVLRVLSSELESPREAREISRVHRDQIKEIGFVLEIMSGSSSWCSCPCEISSKGAGLVPLQQLFPNSKRQKVNLSDTCSVRIFMLRKCDGVIKPIMFAPVGELSLLAPTPETSPGTSLILLTAMGMDPLALNQFTIERGICNPSIFHKFFACFRIVCLMDRCSHFSPQSLSVTVRDFVVHTEARAISCTHPIFSRKEFEYFLLALFVHWATHPLSNRQWARLQSSPLALDFSIFFCEIVYFSRVSPLHTLFAFPLALPSNFSLEKLKKIDGDLNLRVTLYLIYFVFFLGFLFVVDIFCCFILYYFLVLN
jgi:hypothetical protein